MDGLTELLELVKGTGRKVYVTEKPVDLRDLSTPNTIYILQLPEDSRAAGGRGGGFGERRVIKLFHFQCGGGTCMKVGEVEDDTKLDLLDLPYHATAMPVLDPDGRERLVTGVVDPSYVSSYSTALA
jgi:hypothetical protein